MNVSPLQSYIICGCRKWTGEGDAERRETRRWHVSTTCDIPHAASRDVGTCHWRVPAAGGGGEKIGVAPLFYIFASCNHIRMASCHF